MDVVARSLRPDHPEAASLVAGRTVLRGLAQALERREAFAFETTLSSNQSIDLMRRAKSFGYQVGLIYVGLNNADLNVERVAFRTASGGHDIPEAVIRRRYETSLGRLPDAIRIAHGCLVFDNSTASGPKLLARIQAGRIEVDSLDQDDAFHQRTGRAIALGVSAGG